MRGEFMLKRREEGYILNWIKNSNKALIIYGARQVGKTHVIRSTLTNAKIDFVEFNLIRDEKVLEILHSYTNMDDLILKLSLYANKQLIPHKTFVFFDEVQEFPEIVTAIKFLVEDARFRFILSGSILGVEIKNLKSAPVGYLQTLEMYPMDFEEFLQLFNIPSDVFKQIEHSFNTKTPLSPTIHEKLLEIFNLYLIIGGMPAAVSMYQKTNSIDDVIIEHNAIIEQYKKDFTKYEIENKKLAITKIYELIPAELNSKNKRFNISDIDKSARLDRIQDSFVWLTKSGVALPCYNATEPTIPLLLNEKSTLFKLFLNDIGLLTTIYGKGTKLQIVSNEKNINMGAIYENVIAQELVAHGYSIYYYINKKLGELDFVIENNGVSLPIEVKSGKDYARHNALNNVLNIENYKLDGGIVFCHSNVSTKDKITYYPIYMVMLLKSNPKKELILPISNYSF